MITLVSANRGLHTLRCKTAERLHLRQPGSRVELQSNAGQQDQCRELLNRKPMLDLWRQRMAQHHARQRARGGALRVPAEEPRRAATGGGEDSSALRALRPEHVQVRPGRQRPAELGESEVVRRTVRGRVSDREDRAALRWLGGRGQDAPCGGDTEGADPRQGGSLLVLRLSRAAEVDPEFATTRQCRRRRWGS